MKRQGGRHFASRLWECRQGFNPASAFILSCLLTASGCGSGGEEGGDRAASPATAVSACAGEIFIQAPVEAVNNSLKTLTVLGLTFHIEVQTHFNHFELADLAAGDQIDLRGFVNDDGDLVASCLELETPRDEVELRGPVDPAGIPSSRLYILGIEIHIGAGTLFEGGEFTPEEFFARLQPGDVLAVKRKLGSIHAEAVEFDDTANGPPDDAVGGSGFSDYDDDDDDFDPLFLDLDDDDGVNDTDDDGPVNLYDDDGRSTDDDDNHDDDDLSDGSRDDEQGDDDD